MKDTATGMDFLRQVQDEIKKARLGWTAGHTPLLDLTDEELEQMMGLDIALDPAEIARDDQNAVTLPDVAVPRAHDWRAVSAGGQTWNYVSPVKDQKKCGSCGAFSAIAAVEGRLRVAHRAPGLNSAHDSVLPPLSEAHAYFCHGQKCSGIHVRNVFDNIKSGVVPEEDLPYSRIVPTLCNSGAQQQLPCFPRCATTIGTRDCLISARGKPEDHYTKLATNAWFARDVAELKKAVYLYGPLSITYYVPKSFIVYKEGVYRPLPGEQPFSNHALCLVGYNDDGQYFIFKNSWGTGWGESGFGKMSYEEVKQYVTRNDMAMTFAQVYSKKGFLYNDVLLRDTLNDYGQPVVEGMLYKSPDIVPWGNAPLNDPKKVLDENWHKDIGRNITAGKNYIYVRGNSLSPKDRVSFQMYLYFCKNSLLMYPSQWKNNVIRTASNKEYASGVAERYGALALPDEPFVWQPDPLSAHEHYCLIGRVVTADHPNPVPEMNHIDDFAKFVATSPAFAWRNVSLLSKDRQDYTLSLHYEQGQLGGEMCFLIETGRDAPVGASFSLSADAEGLNFHKTGAFTAPATAAPILVRVPAGVQGTILFRYSRDRFAGTSPWTIAIRTLYIVPEHSELRESLAAHLVSIPAEEGGDNVSLAPKQGALVGEYILRGEE